MFLRISKNSKRIIAVLSKNRSPNQIAWGISLGVVLGLIPKDNLTAIALIATIAFIRVNQLSACLVAIGFTLLGGLLDPISNTLGLRLLNQPLFASGIARLYEVPLLPWTCLDNSIVVGGMLLGLACLLPTYAMSRWMLIRANQQLESSQLEQVANDAILYRKVVVDQSTQRREKLPQLQIVTNTGDSHPVVPAPSDESVEPLIVEPKTQQLLDRRSNLKTIPATLRDETVPVGNETILRETIIEVVRYRRPSPLEKKRTPSSNDANMTTLEQGSSMTIANPTMEKTIETKRKQEASSVKSTLGNETSISIEAGHGVLPTQNGEESLRYLLRHINGTRQTHRKPSERSA
jgi:uncharacterized protein (TIGR03546 family)